MRILIFEDLPTFRNILEISKSIVADLGVEIVHFTNWASFFESEYQEKIYEFDLILLDEYLDDAEDYNGGQYLGRNFVKSLSDGYFQNEEEIFLPKIYGISSEETAQRYLRDKYIGKGIVTNPARLIDFLQHELNEQSLLNEISEANSNNSE